MTRTEEAATTTAAGARPFIPASQGGGQVCSETGRLREVIVHRPGAEIARLTPINADSLLFDDALSVRRAQAEHDAFTAILRAEGALVHDFRELLVESLDYPEARALVLEETVRSCATPSVPARSTSSTVCSTTRG